MAKVEVNTPAPDFTLKDFYGNNISLSDFLGQKNVLIVFNRGFMWPYCRRHMAQLRQDYQEFLRRDTEIIVVGPEDADAFQQYWNTENLQFVGLPDPKHKVLKLYGQEVKLFKFGRMPAQMLIDKSGVLRFVHYGHSMSDIPDNEEILSLVNSLSA